MTADEASPGQSTASTSVAPRPDGRSRYSRGRRRPRRPTNRPRRLPAEGDEAKTAGQTPTGATGTVALPRTRSGEALAPPFQPAKVASIQAALDTVTAIIGDLRDVLNDMELVLEYLEDAERQQIADEREIEMLQQRLNSIHRRMDRQPSPSRPAHRGAEESTEASGD